MAAEAAPALLAVLPAARGLIEADGPDAESEQSELGKDEAQATVEANTVDDPDAPDVAHSAAKGYAAPSGGSSMRGTIPILIAVAAASGWGASGFAQDGGEAAIPSDYPGALDVRSDWDCTKIRPEYSEWLDAGNAPASWRHVGKTYRDAESGELYNWQDWLDWAEDAGCFAGYTAQGAIQPNALIGGAITVFGASLIAIHNG